MIMMLGRLQPEPSFSVVPDAGLDYFHDSSSFSLTRSS